MSTINLLPDDYIQQRSQRHANILCVVLLTMVLGGVGGAMLVSEKNIRNTEKIRDQVNAQYNQAAATLQQMQQLQQQKRVLVQKAQTTAALLERVPRSYLLASIAEALPPGACVTNFKLGTEKTTSVSPKTKMEAITAGPARQEQAMTVDVTGQAATDVEVARFITNLLRNPLMASVDLGYSQEKQLDPKSKQLVREFKVRMELKQGVDVIDIIQGKKLTAIRSDAQGDRL